MTPRAATSGPRAPRARSRASRPEPPAPGQADPPAGDARPAPDVGAPAPGAAYDLQAIVDDLNAIVWEADPETYAFTFVSGRAEAMLGYPLWQWIGDPRFWPEHVHPEDRDRVVEYCKSEVRAGRDHDFEYRMVASDGRVVWIRDLVRLVRDPAGTLRRLRGLMVDITAQRAAEHALRESEARLRLISAVATGITAGSTVDELVERTLQTMSVHLPELRAAYSTIDATGRLRVVRSLRPLGLSAVGGLEVDLTVAPHYLAELRAGRPVVVEDVLGDPLLAPLAGALAGGGIRAMLDVPLRLSEELVGLLCLASAVPRPWSETETAMLVEIGDCLGIALRNAQLEERRRESEAALSESEALLRALVEHAPIGIGFGRGGRLLYTNSAFARMYGFADPAEVHGVESVELAAPQERAMLAERIRRRESGLPAPESYRMMGQRRDGTTFPLHVYPTRIRLPDGPATVFFVADLTEQERSEQVLREREEHLRQAQKMEAIGQLAGGVAHDFNNLLTGILGYSDLVLKALPPEHAQRPRAAEIKRAAEQASRITEQLLVFSRKQAMEPRVMNLNRVVADLWDMLGRLIGEHIELVSRPGKDLWSVRADPVQMQQVILNLAVNARDAMPGGGRLTIATANVEVDAEHPAPAGGVAPGAYVEISVRDTGVGMDPDVQARIYDPFFTTKESGRGTGLGLATVYGIVSQTGGAIGVVSAPGEGTAFHVYLPRTLEPAGDTEPVPSGEVEGGTETVLVVEDDEVVRRCARDMLAEHGYLVLEAENGDQALEVLGAHRRPIHLVMTDVVMPGMSGRDLAAQLAREHPGVKVLLISGYDPRQGSPAKSDATGEHFLAKPFTADMLARRVREVLETSPAQVPSGSGRES